jgi:arsenite methyltransferase
VAKGALMTPVPRSYDLDDPAVVAALDDAPVWSAPFGLALLDAVRPRPGLRALDVGSGLGFPTVELAQRLGPTGRVTGLDPWRAANARARGKARAWGLDNLTIVEGRAEKMPFADASFDLVVSNNGTNNVDDDRQAYREIARVAQPGATVLLTLNLPDTMHEFYAAYRRALAAHKLEALLPALAAHIFHKRKPLTHVEGALREAGLAVQAARHDVFTLRYADAAAMLDSPLIRLAFRPAWEQVVAGHDVAAIFAAIAAELDRQAAPVGCVELTVPWVLIEAVR